jgi:sec-independent protein translocase protein TatB
MFDIGIWEMAVIGVVALVVLGPERLPKVARTAGHWIGKLQRYVAQVKSDINREMELAELNKVKTEFEQAAQSVKSSLELEARKTEDEFKQIDQDLRGELDSQSPSSANTAANNDADTATGQPALYNHAPVTEPPLYDETGAPYYPPGHGLSPRSQER